MNQVQKGAIQALADIKAIKQMLDSEPKDLPLEESFNYEVNAGEAIINRLGNLPDEAKGVILALTEYIAINLTGSIPNLDKWKPLNAMSDDERKTYIAQMELSH